DRVADLRPGSQPDRDHDDDRADADDDAQHRQQRAHLVLEDALRCDAYEVGCFHAAPARTLSPSSARSFAASRRCSTSWSRRICPSLTSTIRLWYSAISCSCVTSRMVMP